MSKNIYIMKVKQSVLLGTRTVGINTFEVATDTMNFPP